MGFFNLQLKKSKNKVFTIWLSLGLLMIAIMLLIGSITRLTNSGLSIVEWKLISGIIPPLNNVEWITAFEKYKEFPEYKIVNPDMNLNEFKFIFFWEYLHRLWGRLIGFVFFFPFLYFWLKKYLNKKLKIQLSILLILGGLQGFIGWFMVKSGLINEPSVSHYRLAIHLVFALITFCFNLWILLDCFEIKKENKINNFINYLNLFSILLIIQIFYGAFVAGKDAGKVYNNFPKMTEKEWTPTELTPEIPFLTFIFETKGGLQMVHRIFGTILIVFAFILFFKFKKINSLKRFVTILLLLLSVQYLLGIINVLLAVPISFGVLHQFLILFILSHIVIYYNKYFKTI